MCCVYAISWEECVPGDHRVICKRYCYVMLCYVNVQYLLALIIVILVAAVCSSSRGRKFSSRSEVRIKRAQCLLSFVSREYTRRFVLGIGFPGKDWFWLFVPWWDILVWARWCSGGFWF